MDGIAGLFGFLASLKAVAQFPKKLIKLRIAAGKRYRTSIYSDDKVRIIACWLPPLGCGRFRQVGEDVFQTYFELTEPVSRHIHTMYLPLPTPRERCAARDVCRSFAEQTLCHASGGGFSYGQKVVEFPALPFLHLCLHQRRRCLLFPVL